MPQRGYDAVDHDPSSPNRRYRHAYARPVLLGGRPLVIQGLFLTKRRKNMRAQVLADLDNLLLRKRWYRSLLALRIEAVD